MRCIVRCHRWLTADGPRFGDRNVRRPRRLGVGLHSGGLLHDGTALTFPTRLNVTNSRLELGLRMGTPGRQCRTVRRRTLGGPVAGRRLPSRLTGGRGRRFRFNSQGRFQAAFDTRLKGIQFFQHAAAAGTSFRHRSAALCRCGRRRQADDHRAANPQGNEPPHRFAGAGSAAGASRRELLHTGDSVIRETGLHGCGFSS